MVYMDSGNSPSLHGHRTKDLHLRIDLKKNWQNVYFLVLEYCSFIVSMYSGNSLSLHGQRTKDLHLRIDLKKNWQNIYFLVILTPLFLQQAQRSSGQLEATVVCENRIKRLVI
jgi:phage anti-repressor protein